MIVVGSSNPISKAIYNKMDAKIHRLVKLFYTVYVKLTLLLILIPPVLVTVVNYYIYDLGDESFYLPFRTVYVWINLNDISKCFFVKTNSFLKNLILRLPFDWRTPFGYSIALFIQSVQAFCALLPTAPSFCFFGTTCWTFTVFIQDISNDWNSFNKAAQHSNTDHKKSIKTFCRILQDFTEIKEMSGRFIEE